MPVAPLPPDSPRLVRVAEHDPISLHSGELLDPHTGELFLFPYLLGRNFLRLLNRLPHISLQAGPYVGILPLNPYITLEIVPRVPVTNLARVLAASGRAPQRLPEVLRTYATQAVPLAELRDELADALIVQVRLISAVGLHFSYATHTQTTAFPRGRLLLQSTITQLLARGQRHLTNSSWFARCVDTLPNQLLLSALRTLVAAYRREPANRERRERLSALREALAVFARVQPASFTTLELPALFGQLPHLPAPYGPALELAQLILGIRGLDFNRSAGSVQLPTLLWKMDELFESYLRGSLRQSFLQLAPAWVVLDGNQPMAGGGGAQPLFEHGPDRRLANPDLVLAYVQGTGRPRPVAVFDVKYKPKPPEREDLNQVLAYALSYRVPIVGVLTLALPGQPSQLSLLGEINAVRVYHYAFQLSSPELEKEEAQFAQALLTILSEPGADLSRQ